MNLNSLPGGMQSNGAPLARWWVWLLMAACQPVAPPGPDGGHADVVVRTTVATASECPNGGTAVESGIDADDDGQLDDAEVTRRTAVCLSAPPVVNPPPELLSRVEPEPPGRHCASGGSAVRCGPDANGDGVLQDSEIQATAYACAGRAVARVVVEAAGPNCARGGAAVQSGADDNTNGKLDDVEVKAVEYVCDAALLSRLASEAPGSHCVGGGVAFLVGRDQNGDQTLGAPEVEWTEYECSDVLSRDVTVRTSEELKALAKVRVITGTLTVQSTALGEVSLPALEQVGGLWVASNSLLERLSLPTLTAAHGTLGLSDNPKLAAVHLEHLATVDGAFSVIRNPLLADLSGLTSLASVGGDFSVADDAALTSVDVPIHRVGKSVVVSRNPRLGKVDLVFFESVEGLFLTDNDALGELSVRVSSWPPLGSGVLGPVVVERNPSLATLLLSAPTIESLRIANDAELAKLTVTVDQVRGDTFISSDPKLKSASFSATTYSGGNGTLEFGGAISIAAPLEELRLGLSEYVTASAVYLEGTQLQTFSYYGLVRDGLSLRRNPRLSVARFWDARGDIWLYDNDALEVFQLTLSSGALGSLVVSENDALETLQTFGSVPSFNGSVGIVNNRNLTWAWLSAVTSIARDLTISGNPSLVTFGLPGLETIGRTLTITGNGMTTWKGLESLQLVGAGLTVSAHPNLSSVDLPALQWVGDWFQLYENAQLHAVDLSALRRVGTMRITANPRFPACIATAMLPLATDSASQHGNDETAVCP